MLLVRASAVREGSVKMDVRKRGALFEHSWELAFGKEVSSVGGMAQGTHGTKVDHAHCETEHSIMQGGS